MSISPPTKKKRSILAPLTFPNVKNNAGKHKNTKKSVFFLKASPAFGRRRFDHLTFLCFCFFVRAGVVLDIREGQRCQNRPFFWGSEGGFLTLGKVNGAKIDRFFFWGGGFLTFGKVNCHRHGAGGRCQNRPFFPGRGFRSKSRQNRFRVVRVFWCLRLMTLTFWKVRRLTQGGGPKMAKIQYGVKPDILEGGPKMAKILGGVNFQHFGPPLRPKKCFKQLKKWGRPKIDENFGWSKTRKSLRGRPKKGQNFNME